MKKIFALIFALCVILVGCSQKKIDTEAAKPIIPEETSSDISSFENIQIQTEEIKNKISFYDIKNSQDLVSYLEQDFNSLTFKIKDKIINYFDDYYNMDVQESSCISAIDKDGFEVLTIGTIFVENKLVDCSFSVNIKEEDSFNNYEKQVENIIVQSCINYELTENEIVQVLENILDFNTYSNNFYNNKENYVKFNNNLFVGVIFEGGKDFQFNGTSYFFSHSSIS